MIVLVDIEEPSKTVLDLTALLQADCTVTQLDRRQGAVVNTVLRIIAFELHGIHAIRVGVRCVEAGRARPVNPGGGHHGSG